MQIVGSWNKYLAYILFSCFPFFSIPFRYITLRTLPFCCVAGFRSLPFLFYLNLLAFIKHKGVLKYRPSAVVSRCKGYVSLIRFSNAKCIIMGREGSPLSFKRVTKHLEIIFDRNLVLLELLNI